MSSSKKADPNNGKNDRLGQPPPSKSNRMSYNINSRAMSSSGAQQNKPSTQNQNAFQDFLL